MIVTRKESFPNTIRFVKILNTGNTIKFSLSVVFYVVFGVVCVGGVGINAVGGLLFKGSNIILGNFNIR